MVKHVSGFIRSLPSGVALEDISVSVITEFDDLAVPNGDGMIVGTTNPMLTSSVNHGRFDWSCELSPGPVRIEATIGTGKKKIRSGYEVMQSGDFFLSDFPRAMGVFADGIISNITPTAFFCHPSGMNVTVDPGAAFLKGYFFETRTNRIIPIPSEPTMAIRHDLICLRQYTSGPKIGKQEIFRAPGIASGEDPGTVTLYPDSFLFPLCRVNVPRLAGSVTTNDLREYTFVVQSPTTINGLFQGFGDSRVGAENPSTTDQSNTRLALQVDFSLGTGKWHVHIWGGNLFACSLSTQQIHRQYEIQKNDATHAVIPGTFSSTDFNTSTYPDYEAIPFTIDKSDLDGGDYSFFLNYKVAASGPGGTAYCRGPHMHGVAWRTGGVSAP